MAERTLMEVAKDLVVDSLQLLTLELLSVEDVQKKNQNGTIELQTRLDLEVPKGNDIFSRVRFSCKTPQTAQFNGVDFDKQEILVRLVNPKVTFVDKGIMYLKCDSVQEVSE